MSSHGYSPPRQAIARIQSEQLFNRDTLTRRQAAAIEKVAQRLFLRSCLHPWPTWPFLSSVWTTPPRPIVWTDFSIPCVHGAGPPHQPSDDLVHIRHCPVRGIWSTEALFNAARWIFHHQGLLWTITPGFGGLKQVRNLCVLVNQRGTGQTTWRDAMPIRWPFRSNPPDLGPRILGRLTVARSQETSQTDRSGSPALCHRPNHFPVRESAGTQVEGSEYALSSNGTHSARHTLSPSVPY